MAGSQMRCHKNSCEISSGLSVGVLVINSAWTKKNRADSPRPTTPMRVIIALRSPLSQTVNANQRKVAMLKIESASAMDWSRWMGSRKVESAIELIPLYIVGPNHRDGPAQVLRHFHPI